MTELVALPPPAPGPWVDKKSGYPAELVRIDGDNCWYTIADWNGESDCNIETWLGSMRPA